MSDEGRQVAFDEWLKTVGEDAADDLMSLAEEAFMAGWDAAWAWDAAQKKNPDAPSSRGQRLKEGFIRDHGITHWSFPLEPETVEAIVDRGRGRK